MVSNQARCLLTEHSTERGIGHEAMDAPREQMSVAQGHQEAVSPVLDQIGAASDLGRNDGPASSHRFEQGQGLAGALTGRQEHIDDSEPFVQIGAISQKMNLVADATLSHEALEPGSMRTVTDDQEVNVVAHELDDVGRPNQVLEAAASLQPPDRRQKVGSFRDAQFRGQRGPRSAASKIGNPGWDNSVGVRFRGRQGWSIGDRLASGTAS